ncbi:MAG: tetratricopeptide repeat protein [Ignavibacteriaceae bacterium]
MPLKTEILDKVLKNFFDAKDISELEKIFSGEISSKKSRTQLSASHRKQLKANTVSKHHPSQIYLLITFAKKKLSKFKLAELLVYIGEVLIAQGEFNLALEVYSHVLKIAKTEPELENLQAYSLLALGDASSRQAQWNESVAFINRAKKIFEKGKDYKGCARCENLLGTIYGDKSNIKKTRFHFEKSLSYLNPKRDISLIGMVEINLGIINSIQGNQDDALAYYKRALTKFEQLNNSQRIAEIRNNLGMLFINKGDYNSAISEFDFSITAALKAGFLQTTLAVSYLNKAYIFSQLKDLKLASAFAEKSMEVSYKINDKLSIADLYKIKGIIERERKNYKLAENFFLTSLRINKEFDNAMNQAETYFEMGLLYQATGNKPGAVSSLKKSHRYYTNINNAEMAAKMKSFVKQVEHK